LIGSRAGDEMHRAAVTESDGGGPKSGAKESDGGRAAADERKMAEPEAESDDGWIRGARRPAGMGRPPAAWWRACA
jgi:hypothetical protein